MNGNREIDIIAPDGKKFTLNGKTKVAFRLSGLTAAGGLLAWFVWMGAQLYNRVEQTANQLLESQQRLEKKIDSHVSTDWTLAHQTRLQSQLREDNPAMTWKCPDALDVHRYVREITPE